MESKRRLSDDLPSRQQSRSPRWLVHVEPPAEYYRFIKDHDFASTTLGPPEMWSPSLRFHVIQILAHPQPRGIVWGPQLCYLHNPAAHEFFLQRGQSCTLGNPFASVWPASAAILMTGITQTFDDFFLPHPKIKHNADDVLGSHVSTISSPLLNEEGAIAGVLHEWNVCWSGSVAERRLDTIDRLEGKLSEVPDVGAAWPAVLKALEGNTEDIPFAIAYSAKTEHDQFLLSTEGAIGVEKNAVLVDMIRKDPRVAAILRKAWVTAAFMNVTEYPIAGLRRSNQEIPEDLVDILDLEEAPIQVSNRGNGTPITQILIIPVPRSVPPSPLGIIAIGIIKAESQDERYQSFTKLLRKGIVARITMALKMHSACRIEDLFKSLMATAPLGVAFWTCKDGATFEPTWWNHAFLELFGISNVGTPNVDMGIREDHLKISDWDDRIHPDDKELARNDWQAVHPGRGLSPIQLRVLRAGFFHFQRDAYRWIIMFTSSHRYEGSGLVSISRWAMDMTDRKNTEALQELRVNEALNAKVQAEHFIDMISHELRNPMSAILQVIDNITSAESELKANRGLTIDGLAEHYDVVSGAAEIIELCTQHQKRIVDDVLTLSKLDARLLAVAPEPVEVISIFDKIVLIYENELRRANIKTAIIVDDSFREMEINRVLLDPGRLLQVLINLFTNAIKFTRGAKERRIEMHVGASFTRPERSPGGIRLIPFRDDGLMKNDARRAAEGAEENNQETIFLEFSIEDTGVGMSDKELRQLFKRFTGIVGHQSSHHANSANRSFSQSSPKTPGQYGGSGLGLFITRDLVELHGGQIGVKSAIGEGTTFFCYVKAERILPSSPELCRSRIEREPSYSRLLGDMKLRKGSTDRSTTDIKDSSVDSSSLGTELDKDKRPGINVRPLSELMDFRSPSIERVFEWRNGPPHILLVEDNLINQRILAEQLRKRDCVVTTADNGLEGVACVRQSCFAVHPDKGVSSKNEDLAGSSAPDFTKEVAKVPLLLPHKQLSIVLMDIEMPLMNGLDATLAIRALQKERVLTAHIPIIAVTANARPDNVQKAYDVGMDDVVTKPFKISDLLKKINENC